MYVKSCTILVVVNHLSRPVVVLDGLPGLYGFKYDSATACGTPLYLYSYKLVGYATPAAGQLLIFHLRYSVETKQSQGFVTLLLLALLSDSIDICITIPKPNST